MSKSNKILNEMKREEELQIKRSFTQKKRIQLIGTFDEIGIKLPSINNFTEFINCEISPSICPLLWEELDSIENSNNRFCKFCNKTIYLVKDINSFHNLKSEKRCISISPSLLDELKEDESKNYDDLEHRLLFSKLFLIYKYLNPYSEIISKYEANNIKFRRIILEISFTNNLEKTIIEYQNNGLDLKYLFYYILKHSNDMELQKIINNLVKTF